MNELIIFIASGGVTDGVRYQNIARFLTEAGYDAKMFMPNQITNNMIFESSLVVVSRPFSPDHFAMMQYIKRIGIPLISDWDDDFSTIEEHHPAYKTIGPGNPQVADIINTTAKISNMITVTTRALQDHYMTLCGDVRIIPNGWDDTNENWNRGKPKWLDDDKLNIGWAGTSTHQKDLGLFLPHITKIMRKRNDIRFIIGGDIKVADGLRNIDSSKIYFFPGMMYDDYPIMVKSFDVMAAPLQDTPFNRSKSAIKLVEAAAAQIPYICSDVPVYRDWHEKHGAGLCLAPDEWEDGLQSIINNADLRQHFAEKAKDARKEYGQKSTIFPMWLDIIREKI